MKKLLLIFGFSICVLPTFAQIYVGPWGDVAMPGKVLYRAQDTTTILTIGSINPGPAGANKTWNFTMLSADVKDTLTFTNPNWLPHGVDFPNSNLAFTTASNGSQTYLESIGSGLFADGTYGNTAGQGVLALTLNPTEQFLKFPDTYKVSFQNKSGILTQIPFTQFPGVDSVRFKRVAEKDVLTDGWGNITTPIGTFPSLRHRGKVITTDSIFLHPVGSSWVMYSATKDSSWHFSWWTNNIGYALLEFDSLRADTIRNVTWLNKLPVIGGVNELTKASSVIAYPNPAVNQINFEFKNTETSAIELFDLYGNKIALLPVNRNKKIAFNTQSLATGTYLYHSLGVNGEILGRGMFDVVK